ncbi:hypothetical protein [Dictyobacter aurantiacus]|uniref:Uncharacterized protein n=1 Tax=Dictyobacter aurantiacus TaxID=1936993 RepID=A0A401ZL71_9CHLR|nr:hypothetical protein [Dictyobacter aurantiacus]GCE07572.1 hypothetical protein KDAU_49010 [Dictyobacter aurantiacus]
MIATDKPNPFQVLQLATSATLAEIVSQAEDLHLLARSREDEMLVRWAAEQLRTNQRTRLEYELFELPDTRYQDEEWETFARPYRRKDTHLPDQFLVTPTVADIDPLALLDLLLGELLAYEKPDLEQAINGSPVVPKYSLPLLEEEVICG